jgi:processive 1,2-diacylglycerol beta-glucosyltransferase
VLLVIAGPRRRDTAKLLTVLDSVDVDFQTVVVTGRSETLRRELGRRSHTHPTKVLGLVDNMHELMGMADLIVTKPGGLTAAESLSVGTPLLIVSPIPGQELANRDFLMEHGAAAKVNRLEDVAFRLEQLLRTTELCEMSRAAQALGRPFAAREICRVVNEQAAARPQACRTANLRAERAR